MEKKSAGPLAGKNGGRPALEGPDYGQVEKASVSWTGGAVRLSGLK